ncbi:hypothetical protein ACFYNF_33950 [Streptomyces sp. NPDC006641]|uniref:hypothetical protein n=1 Tax=unclassified Streptomyces TaxID=2593676 RepID=UPI0036B2009C
MKRMRGAGLAVVVALSFGAVGCGFSSGGSGEAGGESSVSATPSVMGVQEALDAYSAAAAPGCETAPECQDLVTAKLAAAVDVRAAMKAKGPSKYEEPIGFVDLAEKRADHYGRDNLGAKGNSFAVSQPLQQMVAWFREHPAAS